MQYSVEDLVYLVQRLRDPQDGCPWDRKQTARSIINYSLEEVYELSEAIEQGNHCEIRGELGDLLFQVVFFAQMASETGDFCLDDVIHALVAKLIVRHPHVFPTGDINSRNGEKKSSEVDETAITKTWEQIKRKEREDNRQEGLFDNIPLALPALQRAEKLQKRAATVGFDWPSLRGPLEKLQEEIGELREVLDGDNVKRHENNNAYSISAIESEQRAKIEEELGDVLFSCANLARKAGINAEQALRRANRKFTQRINAVDDIAKQQQLELVDMDEKQLDELWQRVKSASQPMRGQ